MMGIDPIPSATAWPRRSTLILRLFRGEIVTEKTDWYTMKEARAAPAAVHRAASRGRGGQRGHAVGRPAGRQVRPRHDLRRRRPNPFGYDALAANWQIACDDRRRARPHDGPEPAAPGRRRCTSPRRARRRSRTCSFGFERYLGYLNNNQPRFIVPQGEDPLEWFVENKIGVVGTPDDAIALIERLQDKQGEFGVFLQQAHNWADWEATKRSYELYARYVMPAFDGSNVPAPPPSTGEATTAPSSRQAPGGRPGDVRQARGRTRRQNRPEGGHGSAYRLADLVRQSGRAHPSDDLNRPGTIADGHAERYAEAGSGRSSDVLRRSSRQWVLSSNGRARCMVQRFAMQR